MIGFRVLPNKKKADSNLIGEFSELSTSLISDSIFRLYGSNQKLKPIHEKGGKLIGSAITVKTTPGDNLMIHQAMNMATKGDILVVDGGRDTSRALFGEIMLERCIKIGISGLVINGAVRDLNVLKNSPIPIFAKGVTHKGPYKNGPGEVNVTVAFDDLIINPGDIILGDEDGIVNIPPSSAKEILERAQNKNDIENKKLAALKEEDVIKPVVDKETLMKMGCEFVIND